MSANVIHPTAIIEGDVEMGEGNEILPFTVLRGPLKLGNRNLIGPHVVIGSPGQDTRNPRYDSSKSFIEIGDDNIIREFSAIQKPCYREITKIGNRVFLMQSVHIPHDAIIDDDVVVTPMCVLAGITTLLRGANLGMGATVNQYSIVGQYSIVATGAAVMKNVKPFSKFIPNKPLGVNEYAIKKFGFSEHLEEIREFVLNDIPPVTPKILEIVSAYTLLHKTSGREQY